MQGFAVGQEGREQGNEAQPLQQVEQIEHQLRFEMAGEGVLHHDHGVLALLGGHGIERLGRRRGNASLPDGGIKVHAGQLRTVDHADRVAHQRLHRPVAHRPVVSRSESGQVGKQGFQAADEIVLGRTQVAPVVKLQELAAKVRHVDPDRALRRAGFARQTAAHGGVDLMGEVVLAAPLGERVAQPRQEAAEGGGLSELAAFGHRIDALLRQQAQPLARQ